jgi:sec-independent protein translocase protein TatC
MADADALRDAGVPAIPVTPGSTPPPDAAPPAAPDGSVMTLIDHLGELRTRLFRSLLAIGVGSAIGFVFATQIRNFLISPLPPDPVTGVPHVQVLGLGDAFFIQLKIAIVTGVILAMPVLLYQLWAFVAPGLTPSERKVVRPWIPLALFFFALGVVIAYVVLPFAVAFLLSFTDDRLVQGIAAGPYFDFVTTMFLAFGLVMEFPIVMIGLSRVGILSSERLRGTRRMTILGIAIFAAVATPGGDLVSPFVLGLTMYVLYELTVLYIKRTGR